MFAIPAFDGANQIQISQVIRIPLLELPQALVSESLCEVLTGPENVQDSVLEQFRQARRHELYKLDGWMWRKMPLPLDSYQRAKYVPTEAVVRAIDPYL